MKFPSVKNTTHSSGEMNATLATMPVSPDTNELLKESSLAFVTCEEDCIDLQYLYNKYVKLSNNIIIMKK
jgi:hypothetical protein